jgi:hypothetical protein
MMKAAGKASVSPPPEGSKEEETIATTTKPKTQLPQRTQPSAKRKLVGKDIEASTGASSKVTGGGKKKKKGDKKLLSFGDDE